MKFKYILVFCLGFLFTTKVNATNSYLDLSNTSNGITTPINAQCYDYNNNVLTQVNTTPDPIVGFTCQLNTTSTGYGASIDFKVNTPLVPNYTYALTIYIGTTSPGLSIIQSPHNQYLYVGNSYGNLNTNIINYSIYSPLVYMNQNNFSISNNGTPSGLYGTAITFVFTIKANNTFDYIGMPFSTSINHNDTKYFYGYSLEILGKSDTLTSSELTNVINNSGLATASSVAEVQTGINEVKSEINQVKQETKNINDSINNSDSSEATSDAGNFFSGFETDTFGLTSIITSPLNLIGNITNGSCSQLGLPLPFVNKTIYLPCLSTIYSQYFGDFLTIYQLITFGIVAYWVCVRIFNLVKDFKNPDHDEIEVMDL